MGKIYNLINIRFDKLIVIKKIGTVNGRIQWECICDCGNYSHPTTNDLISGNSRSCGCGQRIAAAKVCKDRGTHFMIGTRLYNIWHCMRQRCRYEKTINYSSYGGRGITVCSDWDSFESFRDWALANGYKSTLTIDRIDVNGNYEPSNCRWATYKEQSINKRKTITLTYNNDTKTLCEWSQLLNIGYTTLSNRIKVGWPIEIALTLPPNHGNKIIF